jgi:hypothetical protein
MAKVWTRNQKLALAGLIVTCVFGVLTWLTKIQVQIRHVRSDVAALKIQSAEIEQLKGKLAEIEKIKAGSIDVSGAITASGGFESTHDGPTRLQMGGGAQGSGWAIGITGRSLLSSSSIVGNG